MGTAGHSAPSVSPSKATYQVSMLSRTTCTLFSSLNYAYTRRNSFLASFSAFPCGPRPCLYPLFFPYQGYTLRLVWSSCPVFLLVSLRLSWLLFMYLLSWVIPIISCSFIGRCVQLCPYLRPYRVLLFVLVRFILRESLTLLKIVWCPLRAAPLKYRPTVGSSSKFDFPLF